MVEGMIQGPEQQQMITWLKGAPQEEVMGFLKNVVAALPRESIPHMVNQQLPNATPDEKQKLYDEIIQVYDFLKNS